jgi:RNA polymerase sigma-70 factor (ECF subfamily)
MGAESEADESEARVAPRFAVDSPDGFLTFYRHALGEVHRSLSRLTGGDRSLTEDLAQETFLALHREASAGRLAAVEMGWAIVVARRKFLDHLRGAGREARRLQRVSAAEPPLAAEPDWSRVDPGEALALLGRLAEDHRVALVLRYVEDLPVAEVAALLERSTSATESLLARARRELARLVLEARDV